MVYGGILMLLTCGLIFFLAGVVMKVWPPKEINMWYGYRTSLSTSSDRAWQLAQKHNTKMMLIHGLIMIMIGLMTKFLSQNNDIETVLILIELIILLPLFTVVIMISTHRYLKKMLMK